jgi:hypothetical protein
LREISETLKRIEGLVEIRRPDPLMVASIQMEQRIKERKG